MKSGFPSAISATFDAPRTTARAARNCSASSWLDSSLSGSSWSAVYAGRPPPQVGRSPRSSGRASATNRTGTSRTRDASVSRRSSWLESAQWMSSNRSIVGPRIASDSTKTRAEKKSVSRSATVPSLPMPRSTSSCGACSSAAAGPASCAIAVGELGPCFGGLVAVEDRCRLLHELGEGAVGRARAVRRRAAAKNTCPLVGDEHGELEREPRLPDPRGPEDGDELSAALLDHPLPDSGQHAELALPTDHGNRGRRTLADLGRRPDREPGRDGRALALREDRLRGPVLDRRSAVATYVSSPTRTAPTGAADWRRAAVLTTSPATIASP